MSVVPTQLMTRDQLYDWQGTKLLTTYGPGYYHFHVTDPGGNSEDEWKVKLGTEAAAQEGSMAGPYPSPGGAPMMGPPTPGTPLDGEVKQIMPGFFHNEVLGLLTTPWRTTVQWRPGDPWPQPPATAANTTTPASTAWSYPGWQGGGTGWGAWPAVDTKSSELDAMKARLEAQERQIENDRRRADEEKRDRQAEELRGETRRMVEENNRRFETLIEKFTSKPTGPSESELRIERELAETRRRAEEDKKEAQRREEQRLADDRHREEMRLVREEIKASTANKPDPMLALFGQILNQQTTSATETARMIRETSAAATAASERSTSQILEIARTQNTGVAEASRMGMESMKDLVGTQREVFGQLMELRGGDSDPPWVRVVGSVMDRIGPIGEALAARNAQQQQQQQPAPQYIPPAAQRAPQAQTVPGIPVPPAIPSVGRPGFVDTGGRPAGAEFDGENDEWVLQGGYRVKGATVQLVGWKKALEDLGRSVRMAAPTMPGQPTSDAGLNGAGAPVAHEAPPPVQAAPAARRGKQKRGGKRRQAPAPTPPADPKGYSIAEMREHSAEDVFEATKGVADPAFFGDIWDYVQRMRATPPAPTATVNYILQGRGFLRTNGKNPPAMELLDAEHYDVLVLRMFPQAAVEYRTAVVEGLGAALAGEGGEGGEGGEDDEGDDDGEEAQP